MRRVAESELANAREALELCSADSRIGYCSGGTRWIGGLYTPARIRWKINQVERMLSQQMPRLAASHPPSEPREADSTRPGRSPEGGGHATE
jgi:hypothetical protein